MGRLACRPTRDRLDLVTVTTRFAPSPTGPLHLGHAYSAILAHDMARAAGGRFLLRIEDIDSTRSKGKWRDQILDDLSWLGLTWDAPPIYQSDRLAAYQTALKDLWNRGLIYPCTCNRRDIQAAASAPQEGAAPSYGPDGLIYPGTCRDKPKTALMPGNVALRLNIEKALDSLPKPLDLTFIECGLPPAQSIQVSQDDLIRNVGDIVLSRKDFLGSYHLSVVLDDAAQNVTDVVRGKDLFDATKPHVLLQKLLGLTTPTYHHHRLIRDSEGKRLAKRDDARALSKYRAEGATPDDIRQMIDLAL